MLDPGPLVRLRLRSRWLRLRKALDTERVLTLFMVASIIAAFALLAAIAAWLHV